MFERLHKQVRTIIVIVFSLSFPFFFHLSAVSPLVRLLLVFYRTSYLLRLLRLPVFSASFKHFL